MIISTFAVLEFAQNVLNVGSGFTKMDLSGITLMQIKETVQRIEGKVDKMLEAPLKNAKMHCEDAITSITFKQTKEAFGTFGTVINEATHAYTLLDDRDISIKDFNGFIQAIQLLIFAKVARTSYDEKRDCFLPMSLLHREKIDYLGKIMEKYVKDCQSKRNSIDTSSWYSRSKELQKKEQVQNIVDTILNISYPYISESKGWTDMMTKMTSTETAISFSVMPQYLPMGEEDKTRVTIGVVTDKKKMLHMNIWRTRTEDMVFTSVQGYKIPSLTGLMTIRIPLIVVLCSKGSAAHNQG